VFTVNWFASIVLLRNTPTQSFYLPVPGPLQAAHPLSYAFKPVRVNPIKLTYDNTTHVGTNAFN